MCQDVIFVIFYFRYGVVASVSQFFTFSAFRNGPGMVLHITSSPLMITHVKLICHGTGMYDIFSDLY